MSCRGGRLGNDSRCVMTWFSITGLVTFLVFIFQSEKGNDRQCVLETDSLGEKFLI